MNREETIQVLTYVKKKSPKYFQQLAAEDKQALIDEWMLTFEPVPKEVIMRAILSHYKDKRFAPEVDEIIPRLKDAWSDHWKNRFPGSNTIYYNDQFNRSVDWSTIPEDIKRRMKYKPDPNDENRNNLLAEALKAQEKRKKEATINETEIKKNLNEEYFPFGNLLDEEGVKPYEDV